MSICHVCLKLRCKINNFLDKRDVPALVKISKFADALTARLNLMSI